MDSARDAARLAAAQVGLSELLSWLDAGEPAAARPVGLYPAAHGWTRTAIQRDLWRRAGDAAEHGSITAFELTLWGHYRGVCDGHAWSRAEVRRRTGLTRYALEQHVDRADRVVAGSFVTEPAPSEPAPSEPAPSGRPGSAAPSGPGGDGRVRPGGVRSSDVQEGVATVVGRAVAEDRRHLAETSYAARDLLPASGREQRRRPTPGGAVRPRGLKTSRHAGAVRAETYRAILDAADRRLARATGRGPASPLLWPPADPVTDDLESAYRALLACRHGTDRAAVAGLLRDGHHHLLHARPDRELAIAFLLEEVWVLRDGYNIAALPVLDVLEHLLPQDDHRRAITARERAHVLEVHRLWDAAGLWLRHADALLRDPRIRWPHEEERYVSAVNDAVRALSMETSRAVVRGELPRVNLARFDSRVAALSSRFEHEARSRSEWSHVARRHALQVRFARKAVERRHGLDGGWDDGELLEMEAIDREVEALGLPARTLAWGTRKLGVLLEAGRATDFTGTLHDLVPVFLGTGPAWPNQLAALRTVVRAAQRRRGARWRAVRLDLGDLVEGLPPDTDGMLRHPLAVPAPLIVAGVPVL
ncbi:hypothetical protein [Actinomadura bangladeshensis]|uniref:Uncharacterized protein n=1 Tax=Actinomadura bangladeshensis TaxID=453573 RepID=A0A4R4P5Y3_9ACTN|nr:hypothetical protein [Actinomadura bangladeshensis]TDC17134.1 hypothetical protein E1284_10320 [Actinomadura bangladeshensis]